MQVYIYTRVSTDNKNQTTDNQLPDLLNYTKRMGWSSTIIEERVSATKTRPQFEQLRQLVRQGKVDVILAWKLDRVARSLTQFVEFTAELAKYKTRLIIPSQGIDTDADTPSGRLQQNILMSFAEFERELIKDRVQAGIERAKAQGKHLGRKRVVVNREVLAKRVMAGESYRKVALETGLAIAKIQREVKAWKQVQNG